MFIFNISGRSSCKIQIITLRGISSWRTQFQKKKIRKTFFSFFEKEKKLQKIFEIIFFLQGTMCEFQTITFSQFCPRTSLFYHKKKRIKIEVCLKQNKTNVCRNLVEKFSYFLRLRKITFDLSFNSSILTKKLRDSN